MKYVEAYYEGTDVEIEIPCPCKCCDVAQTAAAKAEEAPPKPETTDESGTDDEDDPIGCDGCTIMESPSPAFTVSGDDLNRVLFHAGILPHDLVAIVKLADLQVLLAKVNA